MRIKIVGVGGAGLQILHELESGLEAAIEKVGVDSDWQELEKYVLNRKVWLGADLLRGLDAGGDQSVAERAAYQTEEELKAKLVDTDLIFAVAGLGGGTGSGVLPLLVKWAKQQGSKVIIVASLPFMFEGERRTLIANNALQQLKEENDSLFVFSCDYLAKQGWQEGEKASDKLKRVHSAMANCIWGLIQLVTKKGLVFSDSTEVLKAIHVVSQHECDQGGFAWSKGKGMKSVDMALAEVSKSEWLRSSTGTVREVLVAILGGPQLSLAEVKKITEFLKQNLGNDTTHFVFNAILEEVNKGEVKIFVWTADSILPASVGSHEIEEVNLPELESPAAALLDEEERQQEVIFSENEALKQEAFTFETPNRGRFEKTDATFYRGENLDIPTFLRKQIRIRYVVS